MGIIRIIAAAPRQTMGGDAVNQEGGSEEFLCVEKMMRKRYLKFMEVKDYFSKATWDQREGGRQGKDIASPLLSTPANSCLLETLYFWKVKMDCIGWLTKKYLRQSAP